jgi:hypothetical protein
VRLFGAGGSLYPRPQRFRRTLQLSDLVGLNEIFFAEGANGSVAHDCDGLQYTVIADPTVPEKGDGWARQPGWKGGAQPEPSWSIPVSEDTFAVVVKRLAESGAPTFCNDLQWVNYWSYPVKDPMGNTLEIVMSPKVAPEDGMSEPQNRGWQT